MIIQKGRKKKNFNSFKIKKFIKKNNLFIINWGFGDWGLGPIPNPQILFFLKLIINIINNQYFLLNYFYLILKKFYRYLCLFFQYFIISSKLLFSFISFSHIVVTYISDAITVPS